MTYSNKVLHIVSFNVPYPADYGGVIDVFYKIKALHQLGVKVHLHCFTYGREKSEELEKVCASVNYYERGKFYKAIYSSVPYIVWSRKSGDLLSQLTADDAPILVPAFTEIRHAFNNLTHCIPSSAPSGLPFMGV